MPPRLRHSLCAEMWDAFCFSERRGETWSYFGRVARQVWYIGIETEYRVAMYSKNTLVK